MESIYRIRKIIFVLTLTTLVFSVNPWSVESLELDETGDSEDSPITVEVGNTTGTLPGPASDGSIWYQLTIYKAFQLYKIWLFYPTSRNFAFSTYKVAEDNANLIGNSYFNGTSGDSAYHVYYLDNKYGDILINCYTGNNDIVSVEKNFTLKVQFIPPSERPQHSSALYSSYSISLGTSTTESSTESISTNPTNSLVINTQDETSSSGSDPIPFATPVIFLTSFFVIVRIRRQRIN
ncbi:MAG: hypothetical protein ACXAD7_00405 [Candidatus Kariarchaeaceae archaeon]